MTADLDDDTNMQIKAFFQHSKNALPFVDDLRITYKFKWTLNLW
jgi:hypothetical protein